MLSRDSCLHLDPRNLYGTSGNVFENLHAPNEPTAACFGNARSLTDAHCERVSLNAGRPAAKEEELERHTSKLYNTYTEICQEVFHLGILPVMLKELICKIVWLNNRGIRSRKMHLDKFHDFLTFQCSKTGFKTEVCSCSD